MFYTCPGELTVFLIFQVNPATLEETSPVLPSASFMTCSSDDTIRIWNLDPHMVETESSKRNVYSNVRNKVNQ